MFTEKDYIELSENSYWLDENHENYDSDLREGETRKSGAIEYQILQVEDNTINGMQAMAVEPVVNGKVDTSEVVIAYAGTNPNDPLDIMTDLQTIGLGNKVLIPKTQQLDLDKYYELDERGVSKPIEYVDGQIMSAEKFVEEIQVDYPQLFEKGYTRTRVT